MVHDSTIDRNRPIFFPEEENDADKNGKPYR